MIFVFLSYLQITQTLMEIQRKIFNKVKGDKDTEKTERDTPIFLI